MGWFSAAILPENHWVENWTSPAFYALGERHEEIKCPLKLLDCERPLNPT
ncbi:hypothetical protein IWQ51_004211 [Labrenzia sp. EL_142]|nr:hypothetical protein [Labrenzia sp. EL_142]